jgi:XTP/dITP diphosphohydrolase
VATGNPAKGVEIAQLLKPLRIEVVRPSDVILELEVAETGATFAENARLKAEAFAAASGRPVLADDSGLEVDALGGEPGVRSARYGGPGLDDTGRVALLLDRLRGVPEGSRAARFVCVLALAMPGRETLVFEGSVDGLIATEPRGSGGFGYDPVFFYAPAGRTFAELRAEEKAMVSHRGKAIRRFVQCLERRFSTDILGGHEQAR